MCVMFVCLLTIAMGMPLLNIYILGWEFQWEFRPMLQSFAGGGTMTVLRGDDQCGARDELCPLHFDCSTLL